MSSYAFLRQLLVDEFGVRPADITPEATPASLGLDSLSTFEMIQELEREYGISIPDEEAGFTTLAEAAAIVDRLVQPDGP